MFQGYRFDMISPTPIVVLVWGYGDCIYSLMGCGLADDDFAGFGAFDLEHVDAGSGGAEGLEG